MCAPRGERLNVQRLRVLPGDPAADAAQPREVAQLLCGGGSAGVTYEIVPHRKDQPASADA
jgi:hypothetical protein